MNVNASPEPGGEAAQAQANLLSLKAQGAHLHDPVRFQYLEALARRLASQTPGVRARLTHTLAQGIASYQTDLERPLALPDHAPQASHRPAPTALSLLNRQLAAHSLSEPDTASFGDGHSSAEMKSVRRFQAVWTKVAAERQVADAVQRAPDNAGPLNSHTLVLRALTLMQTLSPEYLSRFLSQVDGWLWLQHLSQQTALKPPREHKPRGKPRAASRKTAPGG